MKVRCRRDDTAFDAVVRSYPNDSKPSTMYDRDGDKFIQCPTCGRRYFHYNGGSDLVDMEVNKTGWHSDRPLEIQDDRATENR